MHSTEAAGRETPKPRSAAERSHRELIQREKCEGRDSVAQRKTGHAGHPAVATPQLEEEPGPKAGPEGFAAQRKAITSESKNSTQPDRRLMAAQMVQLSAVAQARATPRAERGGGKGGLPGQLESGIENLSGMAMSHVKVHRNSSKPAQLNAHAFAQGSDIHVAPGQEKHLPHEAWHVVQQAQGRVKPTLQAKGVAINDDASLEKEADVMGARASQAGAIAQRRAAASSQGDSADVKVVNSAAAKAPVQRTIVGLEGEHLWGSEIGHYVTDLPKDSKLRKQICRLHDSGKEFPVRDLADLLAGIKSGRFDADLGELAQFSAPTIPSWNTSGYGSFRRTRRGLLSANPRYASVLSALPRWSSSSNEKPNLSKQPPVDDSSSSSSTGTISSAMRGHFKGHGKDLVEGAKMVPSLLHETPEQAYASRFVHQQIAALLSPTSTIEGIEYALHHYAKTHRHDLVTLSPTAFAHAYLPEVFDDRLKSVSGHLLNAVASYAIAYPTGGFLYERWFAQGNARLFVERFLMKRALRMPVAGLSFLSLTALTKFAEIKQSRVDALLLKAAFPEEYEVLRELGLETRVSSSAYRGLSALKKAGNQKAKGPPPGALDRIRAWIAGILFDATLNHAPTVSGTIRGAQDIGSKEMAKPRALTLPTFAELPGPLALTKEYAKNMGRGGLLSTQILSGNMSVIGQIPSAFWQLYGSSPSSLSKAVKSLDIPHDQLAMELMRARLYNTQQGMFNSAVNFTMAYGLSLALAGPVYNRLVKGAFRFPTEKFLGKSALRGRTTFLAFSVLEGIDVLGSLLNSFQHGQQLKKSHPSAYKKLEQHNVEHYMGPSVHRVLNRSSTSTNSSSSSSSSQPKPVPLASSSLSSTAPTPQEPTMFKFASPDWE